MKPEDLKFTPISEDVVLAHVTETGTVYTRSAYLSKENVERLHKWLGEVLEWMKNER